MSSKNQGTSNNSNNNTTNNNTTNERSNDPTITPVGIDLGSYNARVAIYDETLQHPAVCHNHDGHRASRLIMTADNHNNNSTNNTNNNDPPPPSSQQPVPITSENLQDFYRQRLLQLAMDAAHCKDVHVVTSVPNSLVNLNNNTNSTDGGSSSDGNDSEEDNGNNEESEQEKFLGILQGFGTLMTEAMAVCWAYLGEELDDASSKHQSVLVVDGGASGIKATHLMRLPPSSGSSGGGLWKQVSHQVLSTVTGMALVDTLGQAVAQMFEQKHRFPRGEVWCSKKARMKLQRDCETALITLLQSAEQQQQQNVTIHIDGLYEGMDCQVTMSKPKWDHLSRPLIQSTQQFLNQILQSSTFDTVLLSGSLSAWLQPIVQPIFGNDKLLKSSIDPTEAVAIGCTLQAHLTLQQKLQQRQQQQLQEGNKKNKKNVTVVDVVNDDEDDGDATLQVEVSPISIGIKEIQEGDNNNDSDDDDDNTPMMIHKGMTPLPCMVTKEVSSLVPFELWQLEPKKQILAKIESEEEDKSSFLLVRLQLSLEGQLRVWVKNTTTGVEESIVF